MPRLSDSMEEGTILQWMKQVGDEVAVGDELVEIETDKANMAYESDLAGTLTEIVAKEGETLPIGDVIARVGDSDGDQPPGPRVLSPMRGRAEAAEETTPEPPTAQAGAPAAERPPRGQTDRPKASPLARRLAKERGVELGQIVGSGPGGRIVKADVEAASASAGGGSRDHPRHRGRGSEAGSISVFSRPSGSRADAGIFRT